MTTMRRRGVIENYRAYLPVTDATPVITLSEGDTPLVPAPRLGAWLGLPPGVRVLLKLEGMNPTGSFKDRGMTLAISKACEAGAKAVICASTGNTSAAAAAYAARAGLACIVLIPHGAIALGKLSQALIHGAHVLAIDGNFDEALCLVRAIADDPRHPIALVNSVNPFRLEGQKTAAFEIVDALGDAPDYHALPVGNAGNITAYWKGFVEYQAAGRASRTPRLLGFQAWGAAPLVDGAPVARPETVATAIRIGNPASWAGAIRARDASGGLIDKVADDEILAAYQALARAEGVFVEPACAAPLAGLKMLAARGYFSGAAATSATITVTMTGHGLKDPDRAIATVPGVLRQVPATREAVQAALDGMTAMATEAVS